MPSEYITPVQRIAAKGDIRTGSKGLASSVFAPGHTPSVLGLSPTFPVGSVKVLF